MTKTTERGKFCQSHYVQVVRFGIEMRPIKPYGTTNFKCAAPWCDRMIFTDGGLCNPCQRKTYRYGMTRDEFLSLKWACEVCGSTDDLHIDHNHETGKWRGVLCKGCNVSLGALGESPDRIRELANYMDRFIN